MEKSRVVTAAVGIFLIAASAVCVAAIGQRTEKEALEYRKLAEISGHSYQAPGFLMENSFREREPGREIHVEAEEEIGRAHV